MCGIHADNTTSERSVNAPHDVYGSMYAVCMLYLKTVQETLPSDWTTTGELVWRYVSLSLLAVYSMYNGIYLITSTLVHDVRACYALHSFYDLSMKAQDQRGGEKMMRSP